MEIKAFKAYRFNADVVGNTGNCISPPYDVISDQLQQQLYDKSDYNIVRIIKGKTSSSDTDTSNQYTRAAEYFSKWISQGALKQDADEIVYSYVQDFDIAGKTVQRSSFIALGKIEEFGGTVKPHEKTLDGPKADRLKLQLACNANFGLIFMLYKDNKLVADQICKKSMTNKPLIDFIDENQTRHRVYSVPDAKDIQSVKAMLQDKSCVIADGHHRYETALNYYKITKNPAAQFQMMAFANTCNEGLLVLATHRLVYGIKGFNCDNLIADLSSNFEITDFPFDSAFGKTKAKEKMLAKMKADFDSDKNSFGIYCGNNCYKVAVLKNKTAMDAVASDKTPAWRSLNVAVLHKLILEKTLGIDDNALAAKTNLEYVKDTPDAVDDCIAKVDSNKIQAAFFTNPEKMDQIRMVSDANEKMPQKSTYFFPKVYTGLTVNLIK